MSGFYTGRCIYCGRTRFDLVAGPGGEPACPGGCPPPPTPDPVVVVLVAVAGTALGLIMLFGG